MKRITIKDEYVTLGQLLKMADCISTGGQAKFFLQEHKVRVNGEPDQRRGRKLYPGDVVEVESFEAIKVEASS